MPSFPSLYGKDPWRDLGDVKQPDRDGFFFFCNKIVMWVFITKTKLKTNKQTKMNNKRHCNASPLIRKDIGRDLKYHNVKARRICYNYYIVLICAEISLCIQCSLTCHIPPLPPFHFNKKKKQKKQRNE